MFATIVIFKSVMSVMTVMSVVSVIGSAFVVLLWLFGKCIIL